MTHSAPTETTVVTESSERPRAARARFVSNYRLLSGLAILLALVIWQVVAMWIVRDPVMLPTPIATVATLIRYLQQPYPSDGLTLIGHTAVSTLRILAGFSAGTIVGIAIGALMATFRPIRAMTDPFIELTRPLPPLAFIPILIVWFGIGEAPKVILVAVGVVPVMAISTIAGLDRVPANMLHAARCLGASETYTMLHVRIRAAVPQIITGMRLAFGLSWTSIVAVEMIAATAGLGFVILQAGLFLNTSLIFSGIILIGLLGIVIDMLLRLLQRRLDPTIGT